MRTNATQESYYGEKESNTTYLSAAGGGYARPRIFLVYKSKLILNFNISLNKMKTKYTSLATIQEDVIKIQYSCEKLRKISDKNRKTLKV